GRTFEAELADVALRLAIRLGQQLDAGGGADAAALALQRRGDVAALGAGGLLALLVAEAELHRVVAVALLRAHLQDGARPQLDDGDGGDLARGVVNLRHPDLRAQQAQWHWSNPLIRRAARGPS